MWRFQRTQQDNEFLESSQKDNTKKVSEWIATAKLKFKHIIIATNIPSAIKRIGPNNLIADHSLFYQQKQTENRNVEVRK